MSGDRRNGRRRAGWGAGCVWPRLAAALGSVALLAGCASRGGAPGAAAPSRPAGAPVAAALPIAVLPLESLTGAATPIKEIRGLLLEELRVRDAPVLDDAKLAAFMAQLRMRWVGGVSEEQSRAFGSQAGVGAVLVTSLETYDAGDPPKIALFCRLVAAGGEPRVLWAESVDLAGDQAPGVLGLGLIHDPSVLARRALARIAGELSAYLHGASPRPSAAESAAQEIRSPQRRFRPRGFYRAPAPPAGRPVLRVAVLPFRNDSPRTSAGELMTLHFVELVHAAGGLEVIEPGVVRQALLQTRMIQEGGVSLAQADVLREVLGVDLVIAGRVMDYEDRRGASAAPLVDFSAQGIDPAKRQVVWTSFSYNRGDDRVFFFDAGRIYTAHGLATRMAAAVVNKFTAPGREADRAADRDAVAGAR